MVDQRTLLGYQAGIFLLSPVPTLQLSSQALIRVSLARRFTGSSKKRYGQFPLCRVMLDFVGAIVHTTNKRRHRPHIKKEAYPLWASKFIALLHLTPAKFLTLFLQTSISTGLPSRQLNSLLASVLPQMLVNLWALI